MLAAQWSHRIPLLQSKSPARLAAELIFQTLDEIADAENLTVVDFCSGGGGPTPVIERVVNDSRVQQHRAPVQFLLSDLHPSLDDWIDISQRSDYLSFVPQSVDATEPPPSVISSTAVNAPDVADSKIFRLFSLSFHHFDSEVAAKVLRSTLETSDGFAIVELQDRKLSSLVLMCLDWPLVFLVTLPWFWWDVLRLLFTYGLPILPTVHAFDGLVSCLRTRTFGEIIELICPSTRRGAEYGAIDDWHVISRSEDEVEITKGDRMHWVLRSGRQQHTWPIGYMNYVVGIKQQ